MIAFKKNHWGEFIAQNTTDKRLSYWKTSTRRWWWSATVPGPDRPLGINRIEGSTTTRKDARAAVLAAWHMLGH